MITPKGSTFDCHLTVSHMKPYRLQDHRISFVLRSYVISLSLYAAQSHDHLLIPTLHFAVTPEHVLYFVFTVFVLDQLE